MEIFPGNLWLFLHFQNSEPNAFHKAWLMCLIPKTFSSLRSQFRELTDVHTHTSRHIHTHTQTHTHTYKYTHRCTHTQMHMHIFCIRPAANHYFKYFNQFHNKLVVVRMWVKNERGYYIILHTNSVCSSIICCVTCGKGNSVGFRNSWIQERSGAHLLKVWGHCGPLAFD